MQLEKEGSSTRALGLDRRKTMAPVLYTAGTEGGLEYVDAQRRRRASAAILWRLFQRGGVAAAAAGGEGGGVITTQKVLFDSL